MTESSIPEPLVQVAAIIAGAGLTGTAQGLVKRFLPQIAPEIGGAVGGGLLYYFAKDHPLLKALGVGIIVGSLSPMLAKMIGGVVTPTVVPVAGAPPVYVTAPVTVVQTPAQQAASTYVSLKGGILPISPVTLPRVLM